MNNIAFTSSAIGYHTDLPYYSSPPHVSTDIHVPPAGVFSIKISEQKNPWDSSCLFWEFCQTTSFENIPKNVQNWVEIFEHKQLILSSQTYFFSKQVLHLIFLVQDLLFPRLDFVQFKSVNVLRNARLNKNNEWTMHVTVVRQKRQNVASWKFPNEVRF